MGAGPAVDTLRRLARAKQMQDTEDTGLDEADFFAHGLERGMTHANVQNQVGDVLSEGAARRHTLPYAASEAQDEEQRQMDLAATRYMLPAQIKAQGDLQAASMAAQGRVGAAQAAHPQLGSVDALKAALLKRFESGYPIDPKDIAQLQTLLQQQGQ
jgi:hypothetical protein